MLADRIKWNEKYRSHDYPAEPSAVVKDFCVLASGRRALDIAAGSGRNAIYLAEQGFAVDAVDISDRGLALVSGLHPNIRPVCADLDTFDIPAQRYDLIVNILYLNRRLFPRSARDSARGFSSSRRCSHRPVPVKAARPAATIFCGATSCCTASCHCGSFTIVKPRAVKGKRASR
jgi:SAM-dependent methyltransferase